MREVYIYVCVHRLFLGLLVNRDFDALERWCLPGTGNFVKEQFLHRL